MNKLAAHNNFVRANALNILQQSLQLPMFSPSKTMLQRVLCGTKKLAYATRGIGKRTWSGRGGVLLFRLSDCKAAHRWSGCTRAQLHLPINVPLLNILTPPVPGRRQVIAWRSIN